MLPHALAPLTESDFERHSGALPADNERDRSPCGPRSRGVRRRPLRPFRNLRGAIPMKPLLKNLLGHGAKDKEALEAMRAVLAEIQEERGRIEALVEGASAGMERLRQLSEPLAKTETSVESIAGRMSQMEERFAGLVKMADLFHNLDERAEGLTKSTQWAESRLAGALESSQRIEASMADLASKTELAADLKERLTGFLEVEKAFQLLRRAPDTLDGLAGGAVERR